MTNTSEAREFRPFIPEVTKYGIGRTTAYELADKGLIETFLIGRRRYVYLDSLTALPDRIKALQQAGQ